MDAFLIVFAAFALLVLVLFVELATAILPMLIVIHFVPQAERRDLAAVLASADSSRRLRIWPALRAAVLARRTDLNNSQNPGER